MEQRHRRPLFRSHCDYIVIRPIPIRHSGDVLQPGADVPDWIKLSRRRTLYHRNLIGMKDEPWAMSILKQFKDRSAADSIKQKEVDRAKVLKTLNIEFEVAKAEVFKIESQEFNNDSFKQDLLIPAQLKVKAIETELDAIKEKEVAESVGEISVKDAGGGWYEVTTDDVPEKIQGKKAVMEFLKLDKEALDKMLSVT